MTLDKFRKKKQMIAIFRHMPENLVLNSAQALYDGGIRFFEITFDPTAPTRGTERILDMLRSRFGNRIFLGTGTVLTEEHVDASIHSNVDFIVSPHTNRRIIAKTKEKGILSVAGALTPNEIVNAWESGCDIVKIFPVLPGQELYVKTAMAPLAHIPFMLTGGVNTDTIQAFGKTGALALGAGAALLPQEALQKKDWTFIQRLAEEYLTLLHSTDVS